MASKFMTVLDKIGKDAKAVFSFLGSTKGQQIVQTGEEVAEAAAGVAGGAPAETLVTGAINLGNSWMQEAIKTQALAEAAGATTGSSDAKAAATIAAVTPQALQFAQANGLPTPTAANLQKANDAIVAFLNALAGEAAPATAPAGATTP